MYSSLLLSVPSPSTIPQFYRIRTPLHAPKMLIVADTAAPFLPAPLDDLLVYAADADARALFEAALDMIPRVFGATKVEGNALGAACQAACEVLGKTGGKVTAFLRCAAAQEIE